MIIQDEPGEAAVYNTPLRRFLAILLIALLIAIFVFWRVENDRAERLRMRFVEHFVPGLELRQVPARLVADLSDAMSGYFATRRRLQSLESEVRALRAWRERAERLEYENAQLQRLVDLRSLPRHATVAAKILFDTRSHSRQSILIGLGRDQGAKEGYPVLGKVGLIGRILTAGNEVSRVILLSDAGSKVPVMLPNSGVSGLVAGDNSSEPRFEFASDIGPVRPGQRVVTSGKGGVYPSGLLVGTVIRRADGSLRILPAETLAQADYVRVIKHQRTEQLDDDDVPLIVAK